MRLAGRWSRGRRETVSETDKGFVWDGMGQGQAEPVWSMARAGRGSGWDKGGVRAVSLPTPVSCSDTSFITDRKEAISMGGGRCSCAGVWPSPAPFPPVACSLSQRDNEENCWRRRSLCPAGKDIHVCNHRCPRGRVCAIVHTREHLHQRAGTPLARSHTPGAGSGPPHPPPPPSLPHAPMVNSSKVMAVLLCPKALLTLMETLYLMVENRCM